MGRNVATDKPLPVRLVAYPEESKGISENLHHEDLLRSSEEYENGLKTGLAAFTVRAPGHRREYQERGGPAPLPLPGEDSAK